MSIQSLLKPNGYNLFANSITSNGITASGELIITGDLSVSGDISASGNIFAEGSIISNNAVFDRGDITTLSGTTPYLLTAASLADGIIVYNGDEGIPVTITLPDADDIVTLYPSLVAGTVFTFTVIIGQLNNPGLVLNLAAGAGGSIGDGNYGISISGPLNLALGASGTYVGAYDAATVTDVLIDSPMINYSAGSSVMQRVCKLVLTNVGTGTEAYVVY